MTRNVPRHAEAVTHSTTSAAIPAVVHTQSEFASQHGHQHEHAPVNLSEDGKVKEGKEGLANHTRAHSAPVEHVRAEGAMVLMCVWHA